MYPNLKQTIVLLIMLFTSTFLLSEFEMLKEASDACYYSYQYIADGFPAADSISDMDNHARVSLFFYIFLAALIVIFYYVKNNVILLSLGLFISCMIIGSVFLLFITLKVETFFWENIFSPLVVGLTYKFIIFLWKIQFPEIRFRKSKIRKEYEAVHDLTV
jgi:hypothetical protein